MTIVYRATPVMPSGDLLIECDCCGEMKDGCTIDARECFVCPDCLSANEESDEEADRGDFECHQMRDR